MENKTNKSIEIVSFSKNSRLKQLMGHAILYFYLSFGITSQ